LTSVLVIDDQPPQATRDGASLRMATMLGLMVEEGFEVSFASARGWPQDLVATRRRVQTMGVSVADSETELERAASVADVIVLSRLDTARGYLRRMRAIAPTARVVYDAMDVQHLTRFRRAKATSSAALLRRALEEQRAEREIVSLVDAIMTVSSDERDVLRELGARCPIGVVAAAHVEVPPAMTPRRDRAGGVFVGYFGNPDNEPPLRRLVGSIWPALMAQVDAGPLHIVGARQPRWLDEVAESHDWLRVHGPVVDVAPLLAGAAVSIIPIVAGAGIKTKVLQAMAAGIPIVATAAALRGIPAVDGQHAMHGESDGELTTAAAAVLRDGELWQRLSRGGGDLLVRRFGREAARAGLRTALHGEAVQHG
jgi:glycosyltransferase involved in cell wall biosynthesis